MTTCNASSKNQPKFNHWEIESCRIAHLKLPPPSKLNTQSMEDRSNIWILMSQYSKDGMSEHKIQPFYNIWSYHSQIPRSIVDLDNQIFTGSSFGCFILRGMGTAISNIILLDLASMQKLDLPCINHRYQRCLLTFKPSESDCRALFIDGIHMIIMFCRLGDTQICRKDVTDMLLDKNDRISDTIVYQGQIYCVSIKDNRLFRVEFTDSSSLLQLVEVTEALPPYFRGHRAYRLVESDCDLLLLEIIYTSGYPSEQVYDFKVYKLDLGRRWLEVNGIGDRAILFGHRNIYSVHATDYQMKNSIYYFVGDDINLYIFNLEDGGITKYLPHPDAPKFAYIEWLKLPHDLLTDHR